jgi:hypothetical protein
VANRERRELGVQSEVLGPRVAALLQPVGVNQPQARPVFILGVIGWLKAFGEGEPTEPPPELQLEQPRLNDQPSKKPWPALIEDDYRWR